MTGSIVESQYVEEEVRPTDIRNGSSLASSSDLEEQKTEISKSQPIKLVTNDQNTRDSKVCSFCDLWIRNGPRWTGLQSRQGEFAKDREEWKKNLIDRRFRHCPSCSLIVNAFPRNEVDDDSEFVMPTDFDFGRGRDFGEWTISDLVTGKVHARVVSQIASETLPRHIPEIIDFKMPASWLKMCKDKHGDKCNERDLPSRHSEPIEIILVDVIEDCLTVKTTAVEYFALSYVWGGAINETTTRDNYEKLQQPHSLGRDIVLPRTVSDAILLTRYMGARYLWVDCLSIIQDSPKKHQVLASMDMIYSQAELTIVTSASKNAQTPIAGVRNGSRRGRITSTKQEEWKHVLEFPSFLSDLLYGTVYNTRGWTFQELILSKRLLFVTDQQLVYHCATSRCSESNPDEQRQFQRLDAEHEDSIAGFDSLSAPLDYDEIREKYRAMVLQYSRKQLSFASDIENAFAGLSSILGKWCHGSPIVHGMILRIFGQSMAWTFDDDSESQNCHPKEQRGKRRPEFPSWSWVGWVASISSLMEPWARVVSLASDVTITCHDHRTTTSSSFYAIDPHVEDETTSSALRIRVNLEPSLANPNTLSFSTLAFNGLRTDWQNFTAYSRYSTSNHSLGFRRVGDSALCGMLGVTPDDDVVNEVCHYSGNSVFDVPAKWSLVQLYRQQINSEFLLEEDPNNASEFIPDFENDFYRKFTGQMYALYVLLLRHRGDCWERVGSGFMMDSAWPPCSEDASPRSFRERILLV